MGGEDRLRRTFREGSYGYPSKSDLNCDPLRVWLLAMVESEEVEKGRVEFAASGG